jgi:hypothetical protein
MICSSVNRCFFISPSSMGRTLIHSGGNSQGQVNALPPYDGLDREAIFVQFFFLRVHPTSDGVDRSCHVGGDSAKADKSGLKGRKWRATKIFLSGQNEIWGWHLNAK